MVARRDIPKVVGGLNPQASELPLPCTAQSSIEPIPVSSPAAAEMTKLLENIYRCVNIALVNELKLLCLGMGNTNMPYHVLSSVGSALNRQKQSLNGARALVLGVAYKKDIDDLRESPSLTIIELLQKDGAQVSYHDPYLPFIGKGRKYHLQMKCAGLKIWGNMAASLL